ncbi:MAG: secondary thiamine-phosphate synthase enzyme YjbQ [Abditibacteriota bacterium]|nr:secondary thiamine-phosphate synthase enzyme YjbQ [Abditibacteriota bacterium]
MKTITIRTDKRQQFVDITREVRQAVAESGVKEGVAVVFTPHTTAGVTINENADPDVLRDLALTYSSVFPDRADYLHCEGNSDAHMKSSVTGCQTTLIISGGSVVLGVWQNVYFCEFDGPRTRKVYVQTAGDK